MDGIAQVYDTNAAHGPITADLKDAVRTETPGGSFLVGTIQGDTKGRFCDGEGVYTSPVVAEYPGDIFVTRNSVYRVVSWWCGAGSAR